MQIIFKPISSAAPAPDAGEIWLRPIAADEAQRRDLAELVVTHGIAGFVQGSAPFMHVVVPCDNNRPTLDDMLAAAFLQRLVSGKRLPPSAAAFAKYAALAREGLQPGDMPVEVSMEGIFLAIRNNAGADLSKPMESSKFLADWERMAHTILLAADGGKDPFVTNLFGDASQFARERAFLKKDQDVYGEDVRRGQQWLVQIPGGPPTSAMLVLAQPKSLLWKYWSRRDPKAPVGGSYLLLVVNWGNGNWVISTDPVQRLPIKELADKLQAAELQKNPQAKAEPWFDGAVFGNTLIGAPRGGTKLPDADVLNIVKKFFKARPVLELKKHYAKKVVGISGAAIVTILVTVLASILTARFNQAHSTGGPTNPGDVGTLPTPVDFHVRGSVLDTAQIQTLKSEGIHVPGFAVIVGVGARQGIFSELPASCRDARIFYALLRDNYGYDPKNMRLLVDRPKDPSDPDEPDIAADGPPTKAGVDAAINQIGDLTRAYPDGNRTNFIFFYGGHGDPRQAAGNTKIGYLVLSGFDRKTEDDSGFDMGYLVKFIRDRVASSHQMLLIDCCYSGFVINARGALSTDISSVYEMWKQRARAVITAGTADQQSLEVGPNALFTGNLIKALTPMPSGRIPADANGDGIVTDLELYNFLQQTVSQQAQSIGFQLTPQYLRALPDSDDDVGQFLFIPRGLDAGGGAATKP
jgi:hypothetical protein